MLDRHISSVLLLLFLSLHLGAPQSGPNFFVAVPSVLQIGVKQPVVVSVYKVNAAISVSVQVEDKWGNLLYQTPDQDVEGLGAVFEVEVPIDKVPQPEPTEHVRYVYVRALSQDPSLSFNKAVRVVLSTKSLSVFVQTDKPVYRRNEDVHIRIVAVNSSLLPKTSQDVTVDIKNPQDIIVDRIQLKSSFNTVIKKHTLHLGPGPLEGNWTIVARYGYNAESKSEYHFEVEDYVLPRFDVQILPPNYVRVEGLQPTIKFKVTAKYTYGRGVVGELKVTLGVLTNSNNTIAVFKKASFQLSTEDNGVKHLTFPNAGYIVFPLRETLYISAEVVDGASGAKQKTFDTSAQFTDNPIRLDCDLNAPYYRPNLPLQLKVRARYPSGSVVSNVEIQASDTDGRTLTKTTDKDGIASFQLNVGDDGRDLSIQFKVMKPLEQPLPKECRLRPFSSTSGGNIYIRSKTASKPVVGRMCDMEIIKDDKNKRMLSTTVLVTSKGRIQQVKSITTAEGPITSFQVNVTADLAKQFCVLVYYIEDNNDVAADATCMQAEESFRNNLHLSIETGNNPVGPGQMAHLTIEAAKKSNIALMAVDKGLYILNSENKLSRDDVFKDLLTYDKSCGYTSADSKGVFDAVGLTSISHTNLQPTERQRESCTERNRRNVAVSNSGNDSWCKLGEYVRNSSGDSYIEDCEREYGKLVGGTSTLEYTRKATESDAILFRSCCNPKLPNRGRSAGPEDYSDVLEKEDLSFIKTRSYFPHVWLWDKDVNMGDNNKLSIDVATPHSITEWIIQGIGLSEEEGFGVAKPVSLKVFKHVFIECHLPFSLTRLEQVSLVCTIYNYLPQEQRCCVRIIRPSRELCTTGGSGVETTPNCFTVQGESTTSAKFPVVPLETGTTQLNVRLTTEFGGEEVTHDISVKPEGLLRESDYSTELDPQGTNVAGGHGLVTPATDLENGTCFRSVSRDGTCEKPLDSQFTKEECCNGQIENFAAAWGTAHDCQLCPRRSDFYFRGFPNVLRGRLHESIFYTRIPENYVVGSEKAWLTVSGRYLTGTITTISNIADLLRQPGGCGEQSLIAFAPNIEILKFLKATDPFLTPTTEETFRNTLQTGYQHLLGFRKADSGGFAVWPEKDAATWLSAFALRSLCSARDIILVEDDVIDGLIDFLISRQASNGAFVEHQYIYHRQILGGVQGGDASLTAYVVVSILQCCNKSLSSPVVQRALCKAKDFFGRHLRAGYVKRSYTRALVYNALTKLCVECEVCSCDTKLVSDSRALLDQQATITEDGAQYWKVHRTLGRAYWYHYKPTAISVETTAYALCGYMSYGDIAGARPLAKWLNQQRNSKGAFISTQDTVVALHCLAEFSKQINLQRQIAVEVTALHDSQFSHSFSITDANADVNQRIPIPLNDVIKLRTTGNGLGIAQMHVEYNTPATDEDHCAFEFNVVAKAITADKSAIEIITCAKYLGGECTGMANMEIELPSGYRACNGPEKDVPSQLCLSEVLKRSKALGLTHYEVSNKSVVFYLEKICSDKKICLTFQADRDYFVMHAHPVAAKVYDYYEPGEQCTTFYKLTSGSTKLAIICRPGSPNSLQPLCVCGAGRCPKLERISNRLCNACIHHSYVYKVEVVKKEDAGSWEKIKVHIQQVLKPGRVKLVVGKTIKLWLPEVCTKSVPFQIGESYHVQGRDGLKFILDHTSHIEKWPETYNDCKPTATEKCARTACQGLNGARRKKCIAKALTRKSCKNEAKKACRDNKEFETYLQKIADGGECESTEVCIKKN